MAKIIIDREKCIGCGSCVSDCVAGFIKCVDGKAEVGQGGCIGCGHCYAVCPAEAVSMPELEADNGPMADLSEMDSDRFLQALKSRRSVRRFADRPVEQEKIDRILEAGRYCPTGSNSQDVAYTILGSRQDEAEAICVGLFRKAAGTAGKLSAMARSFQIDDHFFFKGAPLVIVISGKSQNNASLASAYMELMATNQGLGVLYSGFFVACTKLSGKLKKLLNLPSGHKVINCLVIGYPKVKYHRIPGRKPLNMRKL